MYSTMREAHLEGLWADLEAFSRHTRAYVDEFGTLLAYLEGGDAGRVDLPYGSGFSSYPSSPGPHRAFGPWEAPPLPLDLPLGEGPYLGGVGWRAFPRMAWVW